MAHVWQRICPVCGVRFETTKKYVKYCPEHRKKNHAKSSATFCIICGEKIDVKNSRYCSEACRKKAEKRRLEMYSKQNAAMRRCHDCGRPTTDYRCPACRAAHMKKHSIVGEATCDERFLYA